MPTVSLVEASSISKKFGSAIALDSVSIELKKGEILGLLGPNGAGKTTLARILVGLETKDSGTIKYFGQETPTSDRELKKTIAIVPQEHSFYYSFTVKQNLEFFSQLYGQNKQQAKKNAEQLMELLHLTIFADRKAELLSGGYKRLLNIACSLVNDPKIVFLDEPTVALDPKMRQLVWQKISELRDLGKTALLTTHYMDEAQELCDRVALINNGKIAVIDAPENLIKKFGGKTIVVLKLNKDVDAELLAKVKQILPNVTSRSVHSNLILPIDQDKVTEIIVQLSEATRKAGYEIKGSLVKEPELEDVFLNLTGKAIK